MGRLTMTTVVDLCHNLGIGATPGPEGVDLPIRSDRDWPHAGERWRIRSGSGIAGRGYAWTLFRRDRGRVSVGPFTRRRDLARALREWAAGDRPQARPGYRLVARLCGESGYGWVEQAIPCDCGHGPDAHAYVGRPPWLDRHQECVECSCVRYAALAREGGAEEEKP